MKNIIRFLAVFVTILSFMSFIDIEDVFSYDEQQNNSKDFYILNNLIAARGAHGGHSSGRGSFFKSYGRGEKESDDDEYKKNNYEEEDEEEEEERIRQQRNDDDSRYDDDEKEEDRLYWEMINNGG